LYERPTLRIVGEEDTIYEGDLGFDFNSLNPKLFNESLFTKSFNNTPVKNEIELNDDVCVWIDPLDGTLSYVSKDFDGVTTLVGLSVG
jgi:3'-phosphoadenosine 5'-phosphosulfate (PAPS) 3'-phosphatase